MSALTLEQLEEITGNHAKRPASDVKNHWRAIVEQANAQGEVIVTNYNRAEVVVVSVDRYAKLKEQANANDPLTRLRAEFDQELASLRTSKSAGKLRKIFSSSPDEIAKAANLASRRR